MTPPHHPVAPAPGPDEPTTGAARGAARRRASVALAAAIVVTAWILPSVGAAAAPAGVRAATFTGGAGTVRIGSTLVASPGRTVRLTVRTAPTTRCVTVAGAYTARLRSAKPRPTWSLRFRAPAGTGRRHVRVTAWPSSSCRGPSHTRAASHLLDSTAPVTSLTSAAGPDGLVTMSLAAADAPAGVSRSWYRLSGGRPVRYTRPVTVPVGTLVQAWSADRVGNVERPAAPTPVLPPGGALVEAEHLAGGTGVVADVGATGGTAVQAGFMTGSVAVAPGSYTLTARVRSDGTCPHVGIGGERVLTAEVTGGAWQEISARVHVPASPAALALVPSTCYHRGGTSPLVLDWVALTPSDAVFTTAGSSILSPDGAAFRPRGVNRNGFELHPTAWDGMHAHGFAKMRDWGATMVRLQLSSVFWLDSSCHFDPLYADRVATAVQQITDLGMVALLDLHTNGKTACATLPPSQQKMADSTAVDFWREVAGRFKSNPLVAFDLYNEPHDVSVDVWRNGGTVDGWQAAGMQQLYDAVRATGATNLVYVSGLSYGYDLYTTALGAPVYGYGIVYAGHHYTADTCGPVDPSIDLMLGEAGLKYPVVITEFGSSCGTSTFTRSLIDWAEGRGLGWSAFAWNADGPSAWSLLESWSTFAPSAAGQPVHDTLQRFKP